MTQDSVIVVGAGIAGLTTAALLAREGIQVTLLEAHYQTGGCAGTFRRGPYLFDVGATQVAGFEPDGIHYQIFQHLNSPLPKTEILNPACVVDLCDGSNPIKLFYDPIEWADERKRQFPGSEFFWSICSVLHKSNWSFVGREPVLPIQNIWDLSQLLKAIRPLNLSTGVLLPISIGTLLRLCGCDQDKRLKKFLDLQLRLYSQQTSNSTAALYGSTVLQMAQSPLGLRHLYGSMQELSDQLMSSFLRDGGELLLSHRVKRLAKNNHNQEWLVEVESLRNSSLKLFAGDVVSTLPPQSLLQLIPQNSGLPVDYRKRLKSLPKPTGALVMYGAVDRNALPDDCPSHIQVNSKDPGSLFLSISREHDGRAPENQATLIASVFTPTQEWSSLSEGDYQEKKAILLYKIIDIVNRYFGLSSIDWLHKELATPRSFQKWTSRPEGMVGGLGQHPSIFGPFGLPSRTPIKGLWLCGDSIYPGEGTAAVSQSALMVVRQLLADKGRQFIMKKAI